MIKPVNNYILVKPIDIERKGNIFVPLKNSLPYKLGEVVAVSSKVTQCQVGDSVAYLKRVVAETDVNDETHEFIAEEALLYINGHKE